MTPIKVPLDDETLHQLRELAASERRSTVDQASVILTRALARRLRPRVSARPDVALTEPQPGEGIP